MVLALIKAVAFEGHWIHNSSEHIRHSWWLQVGTLYSMSEWVCEKVKVLCKVEKHQKSWRCLLFLFLYSKKKKKSIKGISLTSSGIICEFVCETQLQISSFPLVVLDCRRVKPLRPRLPPPQWIIQKRLCVSVSRTAFVLLYINYVWLRLTLKHVLCSLIIFLLLYGTTSLYCTG